jgi:nucleotide-binding universal stress UspA family protein
MEAAMAFKDILLALTSYPDATPDASVDRALTLVAALGADVTALTFEGEVKLTRRPTMLTNMLIGLPEMLAEERAKSVVNAKHLLEYVKASAARLRVRQESMLAQCNAFQVPEALVERAKLHDLTVVPLQDGYSVEQWYSEAVIFGSGRPVLVLPGPGKWTQTPALDRVALAWDFSRPAARALADAMPLLEKTKQLRVVTITNEKKIESPHSHAELARHLQKHGIAAEMDMVDAKGRSAGDALSEHLASKGCNLLVMGAYGHSRMKEFVLGGTTRSMLDNPPLPVFLSH